MRADSELLLRINQILTPTIGVLVIGAVGIACCQYGPGVAACVHDFYHPPNHAQRQAENSKAMMRHVSSAKFEMNDEMRKWFEAQNAEFEAAKKLGESYRMPPPRRP
jgi:hypothetical protein